MNLEILDQRTRRLEKAVIEIVTALDETSQLIGNILERLKKLEGENAADLNPQSNS